ncbi:MAG: cupin domain-containing protein [Firmicutes bacterium]|nr:cupin domain-containing protein [Bacillota bacterium]
MEAQPLPEINDGRTTYDRWVESEQVKLVGGYYIPDLNELELDWWPRKGVKGAILRLVGTEDTNDCHLIELPPGGQTNPEHHIYEELVFVLKGRGATTVWHDPSRRQTFEWHEGSLFSIPLNAWYQHFNGTGTESARMMAVTSAPLVINLFHNHDFVFNNPFVFSDRFNPDDPDFFSGEGKAWAGRVWETNFIPNVKDVELISWKERGASGTNRMLEIGNSSMTAHISQFPVGTYKKAHRHGPGAHVVILDGIGYSLMWPEGAPIQRFDWKPGSVVVPPDQWFHQHFNVGPTPARYLALRWGSRKYRVFKSYGIEKSIKQGGDQIEYADEAPEIRQMFIEECRKHGVTPRMEEHWSNA